MSCSSFFHLACISRKDSPPEGTRACCSSATPPLGILPRGASALKVSTHVVGDPTCCLLVSRKHSSRSCMVRPWMRSTMRRRSLSGSGGTPGGRRLMDPSTDTFVSSTPSPPSPSPASPRPLPPSLSCLPPPPVLSDAYPPDEAPALLSRWGSTAPVPAAASGSPSSNRDFIRSFAMSAFQLLRAWCSTGEGTVKSPSRLGSPDVSRSAGSRLNRYS
mmetsp:Transcript_12480/g.30276  ORF Transcript_12480/g.30276 Transcript_12480/m.30276 type:complete len:217 (-) Transcript_12480:3113-3763(-)